MTLRYIPQGETNTNSVSGTDSNKSNVSPSVGDSYSTIDTFKKYYCFTAGTWTLVDSIHAETYRNHLGTTDNLMGFQISNGTAVTNSANHRADLSSATLANAYATYDTVTSGYVINPSTQSFEVLFKVQNLSNGTDGTKKTFLGILGDPTSSSTDFVAFYQDENNAWWVMNNIHWTNPNSGYSQTATSISNGDLLMIKGILNNIYFFKNGSLINSINTYISTQNLYIGASVQCTLLTSVARQASIDYIGWKVIV
jgi:hypothetical protein